MCNKLDGIIFFCETLTKNVIVTEQGQTCISLSETVAIWVSLMHELAVKAHPVSFQTRDSLKVTSQSL